MVSLPFWRCWMKIGHHAAAAAHHVAVAHAGKAGGRAGGIGVALHEQLFGRQLGGAVQIDRVDGFVGAERHHLLDPRIQGGFDHIAAAQDIGLDRFHGIVFAGWHLFERCGMDHDVHAVHGAAQSLDSRAHRR